MPTYKFMYDLLCTTGNSNKVYQMVWAKGKDGAHYLIRLWGRAEGTSRQTMVSVFGSYSDVRLEADALAMEKINKKGYSIISSQMSDVEPGTDLHQRLSSIAKQQAPALVPDNAPSPTTRKRAKKRRVTHDPSAPVLF